MGGQPPVNVRRVGGKHNTVKQADSGLGGWMLRKFQGEPLKPDHVLAFYQASFHMTLSRVGFLMLAPSKRLYLGGGEVPKSLQMVTAAMKLKDAYSLEEQS